MENIKAIIFDADDTLIDHKACEKEALINVFKGLKQEYKEEYQNIFRPLDRNLWDSVAKGTNVVSKEEIPEYRFKKFFDEIDLKITDYQKANILFQEGLANSTAVIQNAKEILEYLSYKQYSLYIVTNGLVKLQKPRIINSEIAEYISDIIISEAVGIAKPNPEIFNILLNKINIKPEEAVMIGDSLEKDIKGAIDGGIYAIWYNPDNKSNCTNIQPDYQIENLLELKEIL